MRYQVDVCHEIVLLINPRMEVVDAFQAVGDTSHECPFPVSHYTYRGLLTLPGNCVLCGGTPEAVTRPCNSSGGYHAFVGCTDNPEVPPGHRAEDRSLALHALSYDEFTFYVEADNLFPIQEISKPLMV